MKNYSKTIVLISLVTVFQSIGAVSKKKFTGKKLENMSLKERAQEFKKFSDDLAEPTEENYAPRGVLIFLDDSEKDVGAMSTGLFTALSQQAGPIIVSASLLKNVFSEYGTKDTGESGEDLRMRFHRRSSLKTPEGKPDEMAGAKLQKYALMKAIRFDPTVWIIKQINDSLYLLLPVTYLNSHNITVNARAAKITDPEKISPAELQLGLKIDHMDTKTIEDVLAQAVKEHDYATYFVQALVQEVSVDAAQKKTKKRSDIFCTRADYFANGASIIPVWSIYQTGHGQMDQNVIKKGSITFLPLADFKTELDFCEYNLNIKLFVYCTCFGAGVNTEIVYKQAQKDSESALQRPLSFPVITQAITDAPTSTLNLNVKLGPDGGLILDASEHFDLFLQATEQQVINYGDTIKHLFLVVPEYKGINPQIWGDTPQIKLPGIEWFSVLASQKEIVSIGSTLVKTRDPQKPLDIVKFFKAEPKALLLYTDEVPFDLVIDSSNMDAIISMVPGDATHKIKKISSSKHSVNKIVNWFAKIQLLGPEKIFFIEKIHGVDRGAGRQDVKNVIIYNKTTPATRGLNPTEERRECDAFYTDDTGKKFIKRSRTSMGSYSYLDDPEELTDADKINTYKDLLAKMSGKINSMGSLAVLAPPIGAPYLIDPTASTRVSQINASCTIEKIQGRSDPVDLGDMFLALRNALSSGVIAWIKEMTGKYDKSDMDIPDKNFGDVITITDVVIGQNRDLLFFTYNGKFYHKRNEVPDYRDEYKKRMTSRLSGSKQRKGSLLPSRVTAGNIEDIKKVLKKHKHAMATGGKDEDAIRKSLDIQEIDRLKMRLKTLTEMLTTLGEQLNETIASKNNFTNK